MFNKILIANRGEIAVRIIRACRELGIETVAVYSDIDKNALHVEMADEAVCIGPAKPSESYLNMENIISATVLTGAQAIHPGFGFLSENSKFAQMCNDCNIVFIGPDIDTMNNMGNKSKAREIMLKAKVPIIPGTEGNVDTVKDALKEAERIGYPVMIKAAAGGGGRGIRIVRTSEELGKMFETAKREAEVAFGDGSMYMEKFIENPRHVEFQILGDNYGNVVHLGERDCSIQRRNQKVLEETPCPIMTEELRKKMGLVAVKAAKAVNYKGAGTIEFLLDNKGDFYFMEMNTRIQVEHPITEMVTGIDLVKEQIKVASGKELNLKQEDIKFQGHSIECRVNAENPAKGFMPSPGTINITCIPGGLGIRIDSALYQGYKMPPNYDSMIAKLIVHGKNRYEAISKMKRALEEFIIDGINTNISFQFEILNNENFVNGIYNTGFINNEFGY
ncbi:acetyl-CoA carboxylase biotin carboxylase subunit [Clostridium botulinum C]|uniref:Biotin carboxylase n=3 Tax=Clostridium botulinum TaxID=1491 RepID=A0A9Q4XT35_CLOBO|nr:MULTISPECIES: acetyl-CoA carboxylase biotin carboxylase subunit [Clostridium]EGO89232.2 acetyl-CoA carboxylase [Clostridium botulinum C str. Stockholm]EES91941.1 acetyl-CoA carboxylase, biotin carboxylase subunit [Clostridium botulinum D str. 1873]MBO3441155.1 acetyl-CoA carboxylase biotin carboxylase subunit [Clostridium haemolyticum]MCD3195113.1 acetyl-CoA carboxylase biotin carboxylase subunit [Clostridium botulinum C]MCD3200453.1 acetyl-CoA carboxylase biotin carboxylase subunit [Clostr